MSERTVLVVGAGGREHALAWQLAKSPRVSRVLVAPGNGGTANEPAMENLAVRADDLTGLAELAEKRRVDLTVIGPEAPLAAGIVDHFESLGLPCLGPSRLAARLESSKHFAKAFMQRHRIATAKAQAFDQWTEAEDYIHEQPLPVVIKADGLAGGKGVVVAETLKEALSACESFFKKGHSSVLVEEHLVGREASFILVTDGRRFKVFAGSQDHKRAFDGDLGPNTGGMGAYSPSPLITPKMARTINQTVVVPTLEGMAAEDTVYKGFLYVGLMITDDGPRVLEFNCRFGDPEAQPIMLRCQSDLYEVCRQAAAGDLDEKDLVFDPRPALAVVMASRGYPGDYSTGHRIEGPPIEGLSTEGDDYKVFHAGTVQTPEGLLTNGGRVLAVTALGETLADARTRAYEICESISWPGAFYRRDIGQ